MTGFGANIFVFIVVVNLAAIQTQEVHLIDNDVYTELPRFWTQTGLCPPGRIHHRAVTASLLTDTMQLNLQYVAALPAGSLTHVRIHWLLELLDFVQFTQAGLPMYDYEQLDTFLLSLDEMGLYPVIEFMANPGGVFLKNPNYNNVLWQDFAYKLTKRYLNLFGAKKLLNWRFESWNEPDLPTYNKIHFDTSNYLTYLTALRIGLSAAGHRSENSLYFPLRGPAGLFKSVDRHPLCWGVLAYCNSNPETCPLDMITFHRKGNGTNSANLLESTAELLQTIFTEYPNLASMPTSNSEADPIAGWSTPRPFQSDVRYAATLVNIVLDHWSAKLRRNEFQHFDSISHDNAFLSYHPHEFSQRTLLAHFRMNHTRPKHSQFIQKPVYAALGFLAKLAKLANNVDSLLVNNGTGRVRLLKTTEAGSGSTYFCWLLAPYALAMRKTHFSGYIWLPQVLPKTSLDNETFAYINEVLEQGHTDPVKVWRSYGSPPYPNRTVREHMRRYQTPRILSTGLLSKGNEIFINVGELQTPWIVLSRGCSSRHRLTAPQQLKTIPITRGEVLLTWREVSRTAMQCLKSYELRYQSNDNTTEWLDISRTWHLPFPSFQFAPEAGQVDGFYKVRAMDIFNRTSEFSPIVEYYEV